MVRIELVSDKSYKKYKDVYSMADYLFGWTKEDSRLVNYNGKEYILFGYHPLFMLFWYDKNGKLEYDSCVVDSDYKVVSFTIEGYQVNIDKGLVYLIDDNKRHQSIRISRNDDEPSFDIDYNGAITYMQYDANRDIRMIQRYEQNVYSEDGRLYNDYLKNPFYVSIERKPILRDKGLFFMGRKDAYYRLDFDVFNNKWQYDLATMQEFGLGAVMAKDTITLQGGVREFSRYYRELFAIGDYFSLTGFPILRQYKQEDIDSIIDAFDFNRHIPQFVVDIYNNRNGLVSRYQDIIDEYKKENIFTLK